MLIALDRDDCFLGFDVNSIETISDTVRLVDTDDGTQWPISGNLVRPKLVGNNWIEGATQEEIDYRNENQGVVATDIPKSSVELKLDKILAILESKTE